MVQIARQQSTRVGFIPVSPGARVGSTGTIVSGVAPVRTGATSTLRGSAPFRYEITSPVVNGTYTVSVRDLTAFQLQNYRSRGYQLRQVDPSKVALQPAVKINARGSRGFSTGTRRVRGNSRMPALTMHNKGRGTILKSQIMPNANRVVAENVGAYLPNGAFMETVRDFAETPYTVVIEDNRGGRFTLRNVSSKVISYYRGRGFRIVSQKQNYTPPSKSTYQTRGLSVSSGRVITNAHRSQGVGQYLLTPPGQKNPQWITTSKSGKDWYIRQGWTWVGKQFRLGTSPSPGVPTSQRTFKPPPPPSRKPPASPKNAASDELRELRAWLEEVNGRLSKQVVDLGGATTDRSREIQEFRSFYDEDRALIHKTLEELGRATDKSGLTKAIADAQAAIAKVQADLAKIGAQKPPSSGGILGGLTSFFTTPSNLILIVIVVLMVVMMKK